MNQYIVPIRPRPKARPRFRGHAYTPKETLEYERAIRSFVALQDPVLMTGAVTLNVIFQYQRPKKAPEHKTGRPDLDNLIKGVMDALNGILWLDDAQVVRIHAGKEYGDTDQIIIETSNA